MRTPSTTPSVFSGEVGKQAGETRKSNSVLSITKASFERLIDQYSERVRALLLAMLGNHQMADEVCLQVFSRAYCSLSTNREPWIDLVRLSIAQCQRFRWSAHFWRYTKHRDPAGGRGASTRDHALRMLRGLPWNQRLLLVLREVAELSPHQIATVLGRSVEGVLSDLLNARQRLLQNSQRHK